MARSCNGTTQRLRVDSYPVSAVPLTLAGWFYATQDTAAGAVVSLNSSTLTTINAFHITANGFAGGDPVNGAIQASATIGTATTSTGYTINTRHHAACVFSSNTNRDVYIDGGSSGNNTTSGTPASIDRLVIGARYADSSNIYNTHFAGRLWSVAVWSAALTSAEVVALAKGFCPLFIRPASLVGYYPLGGRYGQSDLDRSRNRNNLTADNSPTWADHGRVIYPVVG